MLILAKFKLWGAAALGVLLSVLGVLSVYFKNKAKRMEVQRDTLQATVHAERIRKKIEKEEKKRLSERVEKRKEDIEEKGYDQDLGSNDW